MPFYRRYEQTKVLLKTEELEVVVSMVSNMPDMITITPIPKNIDLNQLLYSLLTQEFPKLEIKLWWRPRTVDKINAKIEVVAARG